MKDKQKLMFNRKYDKEETPRDKLNRYRSRNRKLEKENKRLRSELKTVERALRDSLERIEEMLDEDTQFVTFPNGSKIHLPTTSNEEPLRGLYDGTQEETQEIKDVPDTEA